MKKLLCLMLVVLAGRLQAQNYQSLNFGATTNLPGAALVFENVGDYAADSGYCFPTVSGLVHDPNLNFGPNAYPYAGYYYNNFQVFNAYSATDDSGNPSSALGTIIQLQLLSAEGPAGASFAYFEGNSDGVTFGTNLTWSVPVPSSGNTNLILITQAANTPNNDPYGSVPNAVFGFTQPGLYKLTWQLVDTSTNGPGGTPLDQPSAPFTLYYQADYTIAGITSQTAGIHLIFAAPYCTLVTNRNFVSNLQYNILQSPTLGVGASWSTNNPSPIDGDDHLHTNTVPQADAAHFFRLQVIVPPPNT